jgi:hypothetical protein
MKSRLFALLIVVGFSTILNSCYKEDDTIAEIRVVTANNAPVPGAEVRLFGQATQNTSDVGNIQIDVTDFTRSNGIAEFDFSEYYQTGQSGFAILNVEITREFPDSTVFLEGIIRVEEKTTTRRTFTIR